MKVLNISSTKRELTAIYLSVIHQARSAHQQEIDNAADWDALAEKINDALIVIEDLWS